MDSFLERTELPGVTEGEAANTRIRTSILALASRSRRWRSQASNRLLFRSSYMWKLPTVVGSVSTLVDVQSDRTRCPGRTLRPRSPICLSARPRRARPCRIRICLAKGLCARLPPNARAVRVRRVQLRGKRRSGRCGQCFKGGMDTCFDTTHVVASRWRI